MATELLVLHKGVLHLCCDVKELARVAPLAPVDLIEDVVRLKALAAQDP